MSLMPCQAIAVLAVNTPDDGKHAAEPYRLSEQVLYGLGIEDPLAIRTVQRPVSLGIVSSTALDYTPQLARHAR